MSLFGQTKAKLDIPFSHVGQMMQQVIIALIPATLLMVWFFGWGMLSNLVLAVGFAVMLEAAMLHLRKRPIKTFLNDYSAVLTAWLLALAMPAYSPWWLIFLAMVFAIVLAKQVYGGLGYNPFNPAMIGYAAMLVSFPVEMTLWVQPTHWGFSAIDFSQAMTHVFSSSQNWDAVTMATALDSTKINVGLGQSISQIHQGEVFGFLGGFGWEWVNLAYLAGGLWMIKRKVITWHIPAALLAGLASIALVFWLMDSETYASPLFHLFTGGAMLGAFFIATDPVSASTTPAGRIIFGASIGLFTYIIRTWGGYPDAIAFSVIIMNMAVPLIDYYTQPRVYGH